MELFIGLLVGLFVGGYVGGWMTTAILNLSGRGGLPPLWPYTFIKYVLRKY